MIEVVAQPPETPIQALVRFAHVASEATGASEILPLLARAAVDHLGAEAAVALQVIASGQMRVMAAQGWPAELMKWESPADAVGDDVGEALRAASCGRFANVATLLLVSGGDLYGALVLFSPRPMAADCGALAAGLVDLAAIALGQAARYEALARAHAEVRASREALARTEKLRALGQMAASVSHDLKNILNPLGLQMEVIKRRLVKDPDAARAALAEMDQVIRLGVQTVERLRDFSRQSPEREAETVDLNRIVTTGLEVCGPRLRTSSHIEVRTELGSPTQALLRSSEAVTALVNLVVNALDAMTDGGHVLVQTGAEAGGGWIQVSDDGPGMPPEVESRVFEPFFTTKTEGTGLGLAIVYAFVQRHRGKLTLETAPRRGTRIRMWFPAAPADVQSFRR